MTWMPMPKLTLPQIVLVVMTCASLCSGPRTAFWCTLAVNDGSSASLNFSAIAVGANTDVSGEYGFGNGGTTGLLDHFVSASTASVTPFGGANRDGSVALDGPQGGLVANPLPIGLGPFRMSGSPH